MTRDEYYKAIARGQEEVESMTREDLFYKAIGSQIYGGPGSHVTQTLTPSEQLEMIKQMSARKAEPEDRLSKAVTGVVGKTLAAIVEQAVQGLARLTRVSLVGSDVESDIMVSEDEIVIKLKPLNRYARLVFEEIKEQYTSEELKRG